MPRICFLLLIVFLFSLRQAFGQTIGIGISPKSNFTRIKFANATGNYTLKADTLIIGVVDHFSTCEISQLPDHKMDLIYKGVRYERVAIITLDGIEPDKYIEFSGLTPSVKAKAFEGNFKITNPGKGLLVINSLSMDDYLEGVVESESGVGQCLEYYKAQAIISRTFAHKNWNKHKKEGYQLCNQVHCQAYLHKRNGPLLIDSAVGLTKGQVLLTADSKLASTFYSANCGGKTCDPVHVWRESVSGLTTIKDTFCIHTKQAKWETTIPLETWSKWITDTYKFPTVDSVFMKPYFYWENNDRSPYLYYENSGIPMSELRDHFKLKSAFFSVKIMDDGVHLLGRGYGHGVGLCQEGAMGMARNGYSSEAILSFYYPAYVSSSKGSTSLSE